MKKVKRVVSKYLKWQYKYSYIFLPFFTEEKHAVKKPMIYFI